ncbi:MAG: hypothetical protein J2P36_40310, partial [Ktedonobacteraceae bacterium]|nr:hypothetical protein [Ktedonobacteraceae bacterium]
NQAKEREAALDQLWASICHQWSVYEASGEAACFLIQILQMVPDEQQPAILELLSGLANEHRYRNRNQVRLEMDHSGGESRQRWTSMRQFLRDGNHYHDPRWMERTHQLVGEGVTIYLSLLQSSNQDAVRKTLDLLACFQELNSLIVPVVAQRLSETTDPLILASMLTCLSTLLDAQSPYWKHYYQVVNSSPSQVDPAVRVVAAQMLARYHSGEIPPTVVDILVEAMLQPQVLDYIEREDPEVGKREFVRYFYPVDCRSLSGLGVPRGLQGLLSALKQGESRWSILDTMRVAEALLDVAFFGCWVENRYWSYRSANCPSLFLNKDSFAYGGNPLDPYYDEEFPDLDDERAYFWGDYSKTFTSLSEFFIEVSGYDEYEATKLKQRYEREGVQALLDHQREAIQAVLQCEVLWELKHNLLAMYGLPIKREEAEFFLQKC